MNSVYLMANFDFLGVSPMLLRFLFGVTVVMLSAQLLKLLLRRYSAALRHRVWSLSIVAVLLLPLLMLTPAQWSLGWFDPPSPSELAIAEAPVAATPPVANPEPISLGNTESRQSIDNESEMDSQWDRKDQFEAETVLPVEASKTPVSQNTSPPQPAVALASRPAVSTTSISVGATLWLVGIALGLLRIAGSWWTARRLIAGAVPLNDGLCRELAQELAQQLSIKPQPRLLRSSDTISPLCIGWWRPCVVVPADAAAWPVDRLRTALAHEFAHVARRDVAWQLTAQLSCAVYWFHPLVWIAAWRMRIERETACDDCVLLAGERPSNYATTLLNLATEMKQEQASALQTVAVAMVGSSKVEQRIRSILSRTQCRTPVGRRLSRCLMLCATAVLLAAGAVSPLSSIQEEADADETKITDKDEPRHERELSPIGGILQNRKGQPVAGAKVFLREVGNRGHQHPAESRESENFAETVSDATGRFEFHNVLIPEKVLTRYGNRRAPDSLTVDIIATARGQGTVWKHLTVPRTDLRMTFHAEGGVRGRLLDDDGKPIVGVDVRVIQMLEMGQLARRDPSHYKGPHWKSRGFVDLKWSNVPLTATTDKRGRFTIPGLPKKYAATLLVDDERFIRTEIYAATSKILTNDLTYFHDYKLQAPGFTTTVQRGLTVSGKVIAADTEEPIAGAIVVGPGITHPGERTTWPAGYQKHASRVETDAAGRFVVGRFSRKKLPISIASPQNSEYLGVHSEIDLSDGNKQQDLVFKLPRGVVISGRVVDDETGNGLPGMELSYQSPQRVLVGEGEGQKVWEMKPGILRGPMKTDKAGKFRFVVSPGPGRLTITENYEPVGGILLGGRIGSTNLHKEMMVTEGGPIDDIEIRLPKQPKFVGRVVDLDGNPVANPDVVAWIYHDGFSRSNWKAKTDEQGRFEFSDLLRGLKRLNLSGARQQEGHTSKRSQADKIDIVAIHRGRHLGAKTSVPLPNKTNKRYSVTVRMGQLTSASSGKILDLQGSPVAGAIVRLSGLTPTVPVVTGVDGSYRFEDLLPDLEYYLSVEADGYAAPNSFDAPINYRPRFEVAPNESHQADITIAKADRSVAGVIVNTNDQPLAKVRVRGSFGTKTIRKQSPTVITDKQGRFKLTGLPPGWGTVELKGPAGGRFYSNQRIEVGSTDVRVVFNEPLALKRQKEFQEKREKDLKARAAAKRKPLKALKD